jgi:lipoprotein-anchoring transpeptidase ErfK/SrfK
MENENKIIEGQDNRSSFANSELVTMISGFLNKIISNSILRKTVWNTLIVISAAAAVLFMFSIFLYIVPGLQEISGRKNLKTTNIEELTKDPAYRKQVQSLNRDIQRLTWKFSSFTPGQAYLVINTTDNRFLLYRNKKLVRDGFCSSGSYTRLSTAEGTRHWIFKTPKGRFWIQQKIVKPLWIRPDWSFVEEGLPIPSPDDPSRYEYGVLGDYAMSLGEGYLIHGTIYKRFLGMPVTHGCVRLNDEDLETIFNTLDIGSKVYIF